MGHRRDLIIAVACGGWAAWFVAGDGRMLVLAPLLAVAAGASSHFPLGAGLLTAGVTFAAHVAGLPEESPAGLAAGLVVVFALGRRATPVAGYAVTLLLGAAMVAVDGASPADLAFVWLVLSGLWAAGALVRHRAAAAERAASGLRELAALDPADRVAEAVARERARAAGECLAIVRDAVERMRATARSSRDALEPGGIEAIQVQGREAVNEMRMLLGLLRAPPVPPAADARIQPAPPSASATGLRGLAAVVRASAQRSSPSPGAALAAPALVAALAVDLAVALPGASAVTAAAAATMAVSGVLAGFAALAAVTAAALAVAVAVVSGAPVLMGFSASIAVGLLAWHAAGAGGRAELAAMAVLTVMLLADAGRASAGNEPMLIALVAAGAAAGSRWGRGRRQQTAAETRAREVRAELAAAAAAAIRAERLRLARELHDVASHAVGAMVLQAGAAAALRASEPARARACLDNVESLGSAALTELAELFGLLDAGVAGPAGYASLARPGDLAAGLGVLVERMRSAGLAVELQGSVCACPDTATAATVYRVVQESLTNAARHAPRSRVRVTVRRVDDEIEVEVRDDGDTAIRPPTGLGAGFGLIGLGERVRAHGGVLAFGPAAAGGFEVRARLPAGRPLEVPA